VLVDRGHRELPIRADYVGRALSTSRDESVQVRVREDDGKDEVVLIQKGPAAGKAPAKARPSRAKARPAPRPARRKDPRQARRRTK